MMRVTAVTTTLLVAASVLVDGCAQSADDDVPVVRSDEWLIGGVPANSPSLDAIGFIGVSSTTFDCALGMPVTSDRLICSATLIGPETIVTAKHCLEALDAIQPTDVLYFGAGPDTASPRCKLPFVDGVRAPLSRGG